MSQLNRNQLNNDINNKVYTNTSQLVTAENVNGVLRNLADSQLNLLSDASLLGLAVFNQTLSYPSGRGVFYFTQSQWGVYRATTNVSPGAFNSGQWDKINQTANNGLTIYNGDIVLGGALDFNTVLDGQSYYGLIVNNGYFANGDSNEIPVGITSGLIMGVANELTQPVPALVFGESNLQSGEEYNVLIGTNNLTDTKVNTSIVSGEDNNLQNLKNSLVVGYNNSIDAKNTNSTSNIFIGTNFLISAGVLNSVVGGLNLTSSTASNINSSLVLGSSLTINREITNGLFVGNNLSLTASNVSNASIINAPICPATASQFTIYTGNIALLNTTEASGSIQANITSATSSTSYFGKVTMTAADTQIITAPCHPNDIIMLTLFDTANTNNYCWLKAQNTGSFTVQCKVHSENVKIYWQIIKSI